MFARILITNLRVPLSDHDRLLFMQLNGNLRLGQSGQRHEDLSGIQVEIYFDKKLLLLFLRFP